MQPSTYLSKQCLQSVTVNLMKWQVMALFNQATVLCVHQQCSYVPKSKGELRICVEFVQLNHVKSCSVPGTKGPRQKLAGKHVFSKLKLRSAYWQFPMQEQSVKKTDQNMDFGSLWSCLWLDWENIDIMDLRRHVKGWDISLLHRGGNCQRQLIKCQHFTSIAFVSTVLKLQLKSRSFRGVSYSLAKGLCFVKKSHPNIAVDNNSLRTIKE